MKFIKKETLEFTGNYDYWDLAGFTAVVMGENNIVSISISKDPINYTKEILVQLQTDKNFPYITKGLGIDAVFVECPRNKLNDVLTKIEDICKTL
jgi:hypothetical protein